MRHEHAAEAHLGVPEITDFQPGCGAAVQQSVLQLQIPVTDALRAKVEKSACVWEALLPEAGELAGGAGGPLQVGGARLAVAVVHARHQLLEKEPGFVL